MLITEIPIKACGYFPLDGRRIVLRVYLALKSSRVGENIIISYDLYILFDTFNEVIRLHH